MVKLSRDILENTRTFMKFQEGKQVTHVWNEGEFERLPESVLLQDVKCPMCGEQKGYPVLDSSKPSFYGWSCIRPECVGCKISRSFHRQNLKPQELNLQSRGVPESLLNASFANISQDQKTIGDLKRFCEKFQGFLLMSGSSGIGKSYASVCCMKAFIEKTGGGCRFVNVGDLYVQWLYLKKSGDSELNLLEKFLDCPLLVLDDLGTRTPSEAFMDFIYILVNNRSSKPSLGTIISTNLNYQDASQKFGDAITSRIGSGIRISFLGNDKRRLHF